MARTPRSRRLELAALVAIGGFAGANLRYLLALFVPGLGGTLLVNTVGSFLLGLLLYTAMRSGRFAVETRSVLSTGFLASFTTYSTFAVETAGSAPLLLVGNVVANYGLGFAGVLLGRTLARGIDRGSTPAPEEVA